jgi:hypothetical protein
MSGAADPCEKGEALARRGRPSFMEPPSGPEQAFSKTLAAGCGFHRMIGESVHTKTDLMSLR